MNKHGFFNGDNNDYAFLMNGTSDAIPGNFNNCANASGNLNHARGGDTGIPASGA